MNRKDFVKMVSYASKHGAYNSNIICRDNIEVLDNMNFFNRCIENFRSTNNTFDFYCVLDKNDPLKIIISIIKQEA